MKRPLALVTAVLALAFSLQAADSLAPAAKKPADTNTTAKVQAKAMTSCSSDCCGQSACSAGAPSKKAFLSPRAAENARK
jgi:hypothetical protein